jgi:putative phosphoribosyl transferase
LVLETSVNQYDPANIQTFFCLNQVFMKMIRDRQEAAETLTESLRKYKGQDGIVLAIPRGGVPIGAFIAHGLAMPLELALIKKIGHPANPEYAIGAVSMDSVIVNKSVQVSEEYVAREVQKIQEELKRRYQLFMGNKPALNLKDKLVIIVDDGIATGQTLLATVELVKHQQPKKVVVAVPVAPPSAIERFKPLVDELICPLTPPDFFAVGQFYMIFNQVSDEEVMGLLREQEHR